MFKVIFPGSGEEGKFCTFSRLLRDCGDPNKKSFDGHSTSDIVIFNEEYDLNSRKFQVHYWDYGGQERMRSMHRIFLIGRTLYILLLNARDDALSDRSKYWIHNVKNFAPPHRSCRC